MSPEIAREHTEQEWQTLVAELGAARELLRALHAGDVDTVRSGEQVLVPRGIGPAYRVLVEHMGEGAAILSEGGTILYCNRSFARLARGSLDRLIGSPLVDFFAPVDRPDFYAWLEQGRRAGARREFTLVAESGALVPVYLSGCPTESVAMAGVCVVATDLSEMRARAAELAQVNAALESELEQRRRAEDELLRSLEEKESLLQEIHHRVRNNLQVVCSLLALQAASVAEGPLRELLRDSENRVRSMGLLHEKLYGPANPGKVELAEYFRGIAEHLVEAYGALAEGVRLDLKMERAVLELARAVPCGLIVNELVSNALEHAFVGRGGGEIEIQLTRGKDQLTLAVRDNGIGLPAQPAGARHEGMGLSLVEMLVAQLGASLVIQRNRGTTVAISFPERAPRSR